MLSSQSVAAFSKRSVRASESSSITSSSHKDIFLREENRGEIIRSPNSGGGGEIREGSGGGEVDNNGDGIYNDGEEFIDNSNGNFDGPEFYEDLNMNGQYDGPDLYNNDFIFDSNIIDVWPIPNGQWNDGVPHGKGKIRIGEKIRYFVDFCRHCSTVFLIENLKKNFFFESNNIGMDFILMENLVLPML